MSRICEVDARAIVDCARLLLTAADLHGCLFAKSHANISHDLILHICWLPILAVPS
jgi:hypothetical protein